MKLQTIEMPRREAREKFLEYRRSVREKHSAEDEAIMRGYRELAQGHPIIDIRDAIQRGGFEERTYRINWQEGKPLRVARLPRLAICRAHHVTVSTEGLSADGTLVIFRAPNRWATGRNQLEVQCNEKLRGDPAESFEAIVPIVPPVLRPRGHLSRYHVLFEADWRHGASQGTRRSCARSAVGSTRCSRRGI